MVKKFKSDLKGFPYVGVEYDLEKNEKRKIWVNSKKDRAKEYARQHYNKGKQLSKGAMSVEVWEEGKRIWRIKPKDWEVP